MVGDCWSNEHTLTSAMNKERDHNREIKVLLLIVESVEIKVAKIRSLLNMFW